MLLYNHVENNDQLLDGMVDLVVGEIDLAGTCGREQYAQQLRDIARALGQDEQT
jgi:hypothetical protein